LRRADHARRARADDNDVPPIHQRFSPVRFLGVLRRRFAKPWAWGLERGERVDDVCTRRSVDDDGRQQRKTANQADACAKKIRSNLGRGAFFELFVVMDQ
jgi:hypothetical protein